MTMTDGRTICEHRHAIVLATYYPLCVPLGSSVIYPVTLCPTQQFQKADTGYMRYIATVAGQLLASARSSVVEILLSSNNEIVAKISERISLRPSFMAANLIERGKMGSIVKIGIMSAKYSKLSLP
jgi:hypothetical protein